MAGLPYGKFFWADWQADEGVNAVSLAAQGLWIQMLCIMARSKRVGVLLSNDRPMTTERLAYHVRNSPVLVASLLAELEREGVFSRDGDGAIISRRMTRRNKLSAARAEAGKKGGKKSAETRAKAPSDTGENASAGASKIPSKTQAKSKQNFEFASPENPSKSAADSDLLKQKNQANRVQAESEAESERKKDSALTAFERPHQQLPLNRDNVVALDPEREAVAAWNALAAECGLAPWRSISKTRRDTLRRRIVEAGGMTGFIAAVGRVKRCSFLLGSNDRNWRCHLDWLLKVGNFAMLLEGVWDDRTPRPGPEKRRENAGERLRREGGLNEALDHLWDDDVPERLQQ